jgi:Oxidoreductase-like protein, N-terminal.
MSGHAKLTPDACVGGGYTSTVDEPRPDDDPPPVAPERPANEACCGGGCARCVFDLYEDAREHYEAELAAWRKRRGGTQTTGGRAAVLRRQLPPPERDRLALLGFPHACGGSNDLRAPR